ncbi:MAG: response regulator [Bacteroidetes bacterium]|nr:response regulator [Bacteroidota bacterium]
MKEQLTEDKFTILVAEDDADDRFLLQAAFKENGLEGHLQFVENGVEAMEYLLSAAKHHPKLILLDLNMPKKDGREVLSELKRLPELSDIPVIIFSTTHNELEMKGCYDLGANSYIVKPDNYEKLLHIITGIHSQWLKPIVSLL